MNHKPENWDAFALLLIDVQEDFWASPMSQERSTFERNIGRLLKTCREEGIDIVHVRARFQPDRSDWMAKYQFRDRIPCIAGTPGVAVMPCALDEASEFVIYKQSFDGFLKPALQAWLEKNDKKFLLVAGLVTSVCVFLTAASAAQRGYLVSIVEDCCADQRPAHEHTVGSYPFVFERTNADQVTASHAQWVAALQKLAKD